MSKTIVIDAREIHSTTGRYISKLVDNLQQIDKQNNYTLLLHPEDIDKVELPAHNFHKQPVTARKFTFAEQLSLGGAIRDLRPDLVHFTMPNQPAFYRGKKITTIHDLTAMRFINSARNPLVYRIRRLVFAWLVKKVSRQSGAVITDSEFAKNDIAQYTGIDPDKITVTALSADKIAVKPEPIARLSGKKFIFFTGRANPHKNLGRLLEAFEKLSPIQPDLLLVFAGKRVGNYEAIEKQAQIASASERIIFTDFVSEGQLLWLYENAQAYLFPSLSEGFGLPGLEAMVHGCPVISSNATCLPEVYGDAAHYFDPLDVDDMAKKIAEVLDDKDLKQSLIKKGRAQASKYSWRRMAEQTLAAYNKVLS